MHTQRDWQNVVFWIILALWCGYWTFASYVLIRSWLRKRKPRPLGNRFHVIDNEIIKISTGEKIPWNEPLFLMRGRDKLAVMFLKSYEDMLQLDGANDYILAFMKETIDKFKEYAANNPTKQPGITRGAVWMPPEVKR